MKTPTLLVLAILLVGTLSGCVENVRDLKNKIGADDGGEELVPQSVAPTNTTNVTNASHKAPVARLAIYGQNGALVYKATFVGEDVAGPVVIEAGVNLTLVGTDSEALAGATLTRYAWSIAGSPATGTKAAATFSEPGVYPIVLTVTDSNGMTDSQTVVLGIAPEPFDVSKNVTVSQVVGVLSAGQEGSGAFEITIADAKMPATIQQVTVTVLDALTCDFVVSVFDAEENVVGKADDGGLGSAETVTIPAASEGTYKVVAMPGDLCVTPPEGLTATVTTTFLPIIPGFAGGDGHGHAH